MKVFKTSVVHNYTTIDKLLPNLPIEAKNSIEILEQTFDFNYEIMLKKKFQSNDFIKNIFINYFKSIDKMTGLETKVLFLNEKLPF